jgi:hypothetical protein
MLKLWEKIMITPINNINTTKYPTKPCQGSFCFTAHKDFAKIAQNYEIKASCYFRRGTFYGAPADGFADIIKAMKTNFKTEGKKDILIIGIADSQETFSLMAVIKDILGNKSLKDNVNLKTIDLQSQPPNKMLYRQSFYDGSSRPPYAYGSFVYEKENKITNQRYRVNDEIYNLVKEAYNTNSVWEAQAQEVVKKLPSSSYNIISMNNVLPYIRMSGDKVALSTVKNLIRITKEDGIIITDEKPCIGQIYLNLFCKKIYPGIWQKKNKTDKLSVLLR